MGSVAPGAIFGCQVIFLFLPIHNNRAHFFVTLLETKLASRRIEQVFGLVTMRAVAGQALAAGGRFVRIFSGEHRFFVMTLIAQQDRWSLADLELLFRAVRVVASQAFSFGNRIVQHVSRGIHILVACQAQPDFGLYELEFVLGSRKRRMAHRALPHLQRAVQKCVFDDFGMALA